MHVELLVEEPSAEAALTLLVPRILPATATWEIHAHRSKRDLLGKLPGRLRGYSRWLPEDWRIVVLVDQDREDCRALKRRLDEIASDEGLLAGATRNAASIQVLNRIAVEELEAWFFGDVAAMRAGYPRLRDSLGDRAPYRDPDAIEGGTWEALERVLQAAGYHQGGLRKIDAARTIARHMEPARNRSRSFQCFREGLKRVAVR